MLLSIGMMVKNEEKYLEKCLRALRPVLDSLDSELIIVDTGSTDNTIDIAKKYTDKVYVHEWTNNFAQMRNTVLKYAKGKWFCFIDADEIIDDYKDIVEFFTSKRHLKANSAFILLKNVTSSSEENSYVYTYALRFFRNDELFCFKGAIHEQPVSRGPVEFIKASAIHYGYINDDAELMEYKYKRNIEILKSELAKNPEDIYYWFQLAQSYGMYGDSDKNLDSILKAYSLMKSKSEYHLNVVAHLVMTYYGRGEYWNASKVCEEAYKLHKGYIDLYYYGAKSYFELGDYNRSLKRFEQYLIEVDKFNHKEGLVDISVPYTTIGMYEWALFYMCTMHQKLGNHEEAIKYGSKAKDPHVVKNVIPHLVDIYLGEGNIHALKEFYDKWSNDEDIMLTIEIAIENKRLNMKEEERHELSLLFAEKDTPYGLLNVVRKNYDGQANAIPNHVWEKIKDIDLAKHEAYYGDYILLFFQQKQSVVDLLRALRNDKITGFFVYLLSSYKEFLGLIKTFFSEEEFWATNEQDESHVQRIKTAALYALLQHGELTNDEYNYFFRIYVEAGVKHIEACYNQKVLDQADISWVKTDADAFLSTMRLAMRVEKSSVEYVRLLRQALSQDGTMKRGIELLLSEVQEQLSGELEKNEFETLKDSVMGSIKEAINSGELETAVALVSEYEDIVGLDAQLASAKGIILMVNGRFDEARKLFSKGLELDPGNSDLAYNLDYLSKMQQN